VAAIIQAKLANYRPVTPGGFFFGKCLGHISRAQRLAIFGDAGGVVSRTDPGQRQQRNRGAALWGNLITGAGLATQRGENLIRFVLGPQERLASKAVADAAFWALCHFGIETRRQGSPSVRVHQRAPDR
jgi:hypothetical protein